jgi:predicted TIM-barrel fold metal-dependent hydrolase
VKAVEPAVHAFLTDFDERIKAYGEERLAGAGAPSLVSTVDELLSAMTEADVERTGLVAFSAADGRTGEECFVTADELAPLLERYAPSFFGLVGLNPLLPFENERYAPRYLTHAVHDLGFKAAHVALHWFGLAPNDKRLYAIYDTCIALDVPVVLTLGMAPPRVGARSVAEPHLLDPVIGDFPDLRIVGQHVGFPWERETVYLARNNGDFSVLADSPSPEHWPADLVAFIRQGRFPKYDAGSDQAMWGSNYPFQRPAASRAALQAIGFADEMLGQLLRDNAIRIFSLEA